MDKVHGRFGNRNKGKERNQKQHTDVQIQLSTLASKRRHTDVQFRPHNSVSLTMPEDMGQWLDLPIPTRGVSCYRRSSNKVTKLVCSFVNSNISVVFFDVLSTLALVARV